MSLLMPHIMLSNKLIISILVFASLSSGVSAQTIAEVAEQQRAAKLPKPAVVVEEVKVAPVKKHIRKSRFVVLATYEVNDARNALINIGGTISTYAVGDQVNGYKIQSIDYSTITVGTCNKNKKCKAQRVRVGAGL